MTPSDPHAAEPDAGRGGPTVDRAGLEELDDGFRARDYLRLVYKWRRLAATLWLLVFVAAIVYGFTATPLYDATTTLLIEVDEPNVVTFEEVIEEGRVNPDYYQTQYDVLASRSLARRTIERLGIWDHPDLGGSTEAARAASDDGVMAGSAGSAARTRVVDRFLGRLRVAPVRNSRTVDVTFRSSSPEIAARVVNTLARAHIEWNLEFRFQSSREASDWLRERLAEQRAQVEASELALQRYREANDAISLDTRQDVVVQELVDLNAALTRARTERIEKEARYRRFEALQDRSGAIDTLPEILSNSFVQNQKARVADLRRQEARLAENLGDRHPDLIEVRRAMQAAEEELRIETVRVIESVGNDFQAAAAQERGLWRELETQKDEALALNRTGIEYGVLTREAESNRQIYEALLQRANETGVAGELRTSNIRVVDEAEVPVRSAHPRRLMIALGGLFSGLGLAVGLVLLLDRLDNRMTTPDDIQNCLGLAFLGMVPVVEGDRSAQRLLAAGDASAQRLLVDGGVADANFAESVRSIRTNLVFSSAAQGCRTIAVTSTAPGEGKSLLAGNLAIALAQTYERVLLLDADLRRPQVHVTFGQTLQPGLSDLLVGQAKAADVLRRDVVTKLPSLSLIPAGTLPPNPAELILSVRFQEYLSSLTESFEWIVVDTPPVMPVTDAAVISRLVTGVLFMVDATKPVRRSAPKALEQLSRAHARVAGAVLNRVDFVNNPYYYADHYRREYRTYYRRP